MNFILEQNKMSQIMVYYMFKFVMISALLISLKVRDLMAINYNDDDDDGEDDGEDDQDDEDIDEEKISSNKTTTEHQTSDCVTVEDQETIPSISCLSSNPINSQTPKKQQLPLASNLSNHQSDEPGVISTILTKLKKKFFDYLKF
jgi:hypothetical protein